jgi:carbon-monoxide dehydrogenase medium subunit
VIPAAFDYKVAPSVYDACEMLTEYGEDAKLLAGGHSLLPLMKLRLATPSVLIDVGRLANLAYVLDAGEELQIGALTKHHTLETDPLVQSACPLLAYAASQVGDPQVRHRGTLGGTLAHGDPASDLPAVILALNGTMVIRGPRGQREVQAVDFFTGFLETALEPDEMLIQVRVPKTGSAGWSFQKFNRRAQDWAIVGVAYAVGHGVALVNMGSVPLRATGVEEALAAGASAVDAASVASEGTEPPADLNASVEFRRHLANVLVRRALEEAGARG